MQHQGQVYIPLINYLLMTLCLIITGTFQSSANIGKAYGGFPCPCGSRGSRRRLVGKHGLPRAPCCSRCCLPVTSMQTYRTQGESIHAHATDLVLWHKLGHVRTGCVARCSHPPAARRPKSEGREEGDPDVPCSRLVTSAVAAAPCVATPSGLASRCQPLLHNPVPAASPWNPKSDEARSLPRPGLAVLCDMVLTTHFMALIIVTVWRLPLLAAAAFYLFFAPIEVTYLSSAFEKIPTGASLLPLIHLCQIPPCTAS